MSFREMQTEVAKSCFEQIDKLRTEVADIMIGRVDATIRGTYFAKQLNPAERIVLRNLALGFVHRRLSEVFVALLAMGIDISEFSSWAGTVEEFIAQLEAEYAPPAEEPAP